MELCGMLYMLIGLVGMAMEVDMGRWSEMLEGLKLVLEEGEESIRSMRV